MTNTKIVEFLRKKDFELIRDIGQGGTGKTVLLFDRTINEHFVCKKYQPFYDEHIEMYYQNFLNEIKILHMINHPNIVRVFNYYLYPENHTGYILMEEIKGKAIDLFLNDNIHQINNVFIQLIQGFVDLQESSILHRDIRPENILVTDNGIVKIIDFGFGKSFESSEKFEKSISINWRYSVPKEFKNGIYNFQTEIYFIGKLMEEILNYNQVINFKYSSIISKMIHYENSLRYLDFFEIYRDMTSALIMENPFSDYETSKYRNFTNELFETISHLEPGIQYLRNVEEVIRELEKIYMNSCLEIKVHDVAGLLRCFLKGNFAYFKNKKCNVIYLKSFIELLRNSSEDKKRIILNNIWSRFDNVTRNSDIEADDLPF